MAQPQNTSAFVWIGRQKWILVVAAVIAAVVTAYWYFSSYRPKSVATEYIANTLNDPESAKFRNVRLVNGIVICGEVNGKNLHGAYVGFTPFFYMSTGSDFALAFIKTDNPDTDIARAGNAMIAKECTPVVLKKEKDEKTPLISETSRDGKAPIFLDLGTFVANLQHENGDQYLQVAISLKLTKSDIQEKISANKPAIKAKINALLQSKRASELATYDGKEKLANEIKTQIENVLGVSGLSEVLFTSFIIQ